MKIGCHLSISAGAGSKGQQIINALLLLPDLGANAIQVFLSPRHGASSGKPIKEDEAEEIQALLRGSRTYFVIHGKYDLNFCDPVVKWYQTALISDLRKANQLGSDIGVVIHQGKNIARLKLSEDQAITNYTNNVKEVLEKTRDIANPIFLENSCQQGTELGYTLEGLAKIWNKFTSAEKKRLGFCLDTCHIFVSGTLQMRDQDEVDAFFEKFEGLIGLKYLRLIHFNDSKTPFDGHNDHHHDIMGGFITNPDYQSPVKKYAQVGPGGRGTEEGLKRVLAWAKKLDIPCILETPQEVYAIQDQLEVVNQWGDSVDLNRKVPKKEIKLVIKKPLNSFKP